MNNNAARRTYPYNFLWEACIRLGNGRGFISDYALIAEGALDQDERDRWIPARAVCNA